MAEFVTVMKDFMRRCINRKCSECPIDMLCDDSDECRSYCIENPEEAEKIIMDWAAANPVETMKDRFFKMFPNADSDDDGTPKCCPHHIGWAKRCWKYEGSTPTCSACWNRPYEERSAE